MLKEKVLEEYLPLLEIIEDPIWLGEFLRSTNDGSVNKAEWPSEEFHYNWYQKDILSDTTPEITVVGGRSIGKCQPSDSYVLTTSGYKMIRDLRDLPYVEMWAYDGKQYVRKRGAFSDNGVQMVYTVQTTHSRVDATANHPFLTYNTQTGQRAYTPLEQLNPSIHRIGIASTLPHVNGENAFEWEELRFLGYTLGHHFQAVQIPLRPKYASQLAELRQIADKYGLRLVRRDGAYKVMGKPRQKSALAQLLVELEAHTRRLPTIIPYKLTEQSNGAIKVMLESFFSYWGKITPTDISYYHKYPVFLDQLQALLQRFSIMSRVEKVTEGVEGRDLRLIIDDPYSLYVFSTTFTLPGIRLQYQRVANPAKDGILFVPILDITERRTMRTYALQVRDCHTYIAEGGTVVHNSIFQEDRLIWEAVNSDLVFPDKPEQTLTTANGTQMEPLFSRLVTRFSAGALLKDYLDNNVNRTKATFEFPARTGKRQYKLFARIAGTDDANNVVGLHTDRIKMDESQLYPWGTWIQLLPTYLQ